jgi:hypothetical protein
VCDRGCRTPTGATGRQGADRASTRARPGFDRGADRPARGARRADLGTVAEGNPFAELGLAPRLVQRMARDGITTPFPIQTATIPDALAGRDVLGRGQTGSGQDARLRACRC